MRWNTDKQTGQIYPNHFTAQEVEQFVAFVMAKELEDSPSQSDVEHIIKRCVDTFDWVHKGDLEYVFNTLVEVHDRMAGCHARYKARHFQGDLIKS